MFLLKRPKKHYIIFTLLIIFPLTVLFSIIPSTLLAQISNNDYRIPSSVFSAGGGISSALGVINNGVVGQPLISNAITNLEHTVASGFIYTFMLYEVDYCFRDFDGDSYGDPAREIGGTPCPSGYVDNYQDCDDANAYINPDALEVCDGIDNNCNSFIDEEGEKVVGEDWVAEFNGPGNGDDEAIDIAIDSSGNVYVTGSSNVGVNSGYATVKYDPNGNEIWVKRYNGQGNGVDKATDIAVDSSENVYVTGGSEGDYATVKYDPNGNEIWLSRYSGGSSYAKAIAVDSLGNVYVTGESYMIGSSDYATIKYDPNGQEIWVAVYDSPWYGWDSANAIAIDSLGNVYVTGRCEGITKDYATVKYYTDGNELWVRLYNGLGNGSNEAIDIAVDAWGNVYVTGTSYGSETGLDYATVKYDTDGNELWVRRYNGPENGNDEVTDIAVGSSGNVYVTGSSNVGINSDYATVKYDPNGNEIWVRRYNGPGNGEDKAAGIAINSWGNVYVTGTSYSTETGLDYATVEYDTNGNELWLRRCNGLGNADDEASAIAVDSSGNVYVTGKSYGGFSAGYNYATVKYANICVAEIVEDEFEPDDDPNQILTDIYHNDISHKIIVNDPPQIHTFYCEDPNGCIDIDFLYFYGVKGHTYEIFARDISSDNYPVRLALYDTNIQLLYEDGTPMISDNYLVFECKQSGYYLIMTQSDTSKPVYKPHKYFILVTDSETSEQFGTLLLKVIDPWKRGRPCVRWQLKKQIGNEDYYLPGDYLFIYPDIYYYKIKSPPDTNIIIMVYGSDQCGNQCSDKCSNDPLAETFVELRYHYLNKATIDLSNIIEPVVPDPNIDNNDYKRIMEYYKQQIKYGPWCDHNFLPYGDMNSNFPQEGNYDGDQKENLYEHFCYESHPGYPTFFLPLHKGMNLYYFPSINDRPNIISSDQIQFYHYNNSLDAWTSEKNVTIKSNTFNAIYAHGGGTLSLDLIIPNHSVFCLSSPLGSNYFPQMNSDEIKEYLNQYEEWSRFVQIDGTTNPEFPTLRWNPDEIASELGPAALIIGDPNRLDLLVGDMSNSDINSYKTKRQDAIICFDFISVALLSYAIVPYNITFDLTVDIPSGWSMISLPVIPNITALSDLLPDAKVVYGYEPGTGYVRVKNDEGLEARKGYWILLDKNISYTLTGRPVLSNPLSMNKNGWEMIGGLSFPVPASIENGKIEVIYKYVPGIGYQRVPESENLEPGKGYWMLIKGISN